MTIAADTPDRDRPVIDPNTALELAPGTWFFTSINPDGSTTIWSAGNNTGIHGCNCATCAPHDQTDSAPTAPPPRRHPLDERQGD